MRNPNLWPAEQNLSPYSLVCQGNGPVLKIRMFQSSLCSGIPWVIAILKTIACDPFGSSPARAQRYGSALLPHFPSVISAPGIGATQAVPRHPSWI
jgi:hypothetical protein